MASRWRNSIALTPVSAPSASALGDQGGGAFRLGRQRAAIHTERAGDQSVAEQPALYPRQWKHAGDRAVLFSEAVMRGKPVAAFITEPSRAMETCPWASNPRNDPMSPRDPCQGCGG